MTRTCITRCALLVAVAASAHPAGAQTFTGYLSGETGGVVRLSGSAYVCDADEGEPFIILKDSATERAISLNFSEPLRPDQVVYPIADVQNGEPPVYLVHHPEGAGTRRYRTARGNVTFTSGSPRALEGDIQFAGETASGERDAITASFVAQSLGVVDGNCDPVAKEQRVRGFGWSEVHTRAVLSGEVEVGMTADMVYETWGTPRDADRTRTAAGTEEVWSYINATVVLRNGTVAEIRD